VFPAWGGLGMIWYEMPLSIGMLLLILFLLSSALQAVVSLMVKELLLERRSMLFIRLLYSLLSVTSAALTVEAILAVASIEGGVYLLISPLFRYTSVLPIFLFIYAIKYPPKLPAQLSLHTENYFIPLLLLPFWRLPLPLHILFISFSAAWFMLDGARMLLTLRRYARQEITRSIIAHVIQSMSHGICIADQRGWILESNPAFHQHCEGLGISAVDQIGKLNKVLEALAKASRIKITELENGRLIQAESVLLLQQRHFESNNRIFIELTLSDISKLTHTAASLDHENISLKWKNILLERAIAEIKSELASLEREKLCRSAHDLWSQRLAVAGLSLDILIKSEHSSINNEDLNAIQLTLDATSETLSTQRMRKLSEALQELTEMYGRLGVKICVSGEASFSSPVQETLIDVIKEALANAVRHAYSQQVDLHFYESSVLAGVAIQNACLDNKPQIVDGRGLHDMKARVHNAGGAMHYEKNDRFKLNITFPKTLSIHEETVK